MKHILATFISICLAIISLPIQDVFANTKFSCDNVIQIPKTECEALVALSQSTDGGHWKNKNGWLTTNTPCNWHGVTCGWDTPYRRYDSYDPGHVERLELKDEGLMGKLPEDLNQLSHLKYLDFSYNVLTGSIPPEIGDLPHLEVLDLSKNSLRGGIPPELGNLFYLRRLQLGFNRLTGEIPVKIGSLSNLESLDLSTNNLSGLIPPEIGNLSNLETLNLGGNSFTGPLPLEVGYLTKLRYLDVASNPLHGPLPLSLTQTPLRGFDYNHTDICEPEDQDLQSLLKNLDFGFTNDLACCSISSVITSTTAISVCGEPLYKLITAIDKSEDCGYHLDSKITASLVKYGEDYLNHCITLDLPLTEQINTFENLVELEPPPSLITDTSRYKNFHNSFFNLVDWNSDGIDDLTWHVGYVYRDSIWWGQSFLFYSGEGKNNWRGMPLSEYWGSPKIPSVYPLKFHDSQGHPFIAVDTGIIGGDHDANELHIWRWLDNAPELVLTIGLSNWCGQPNEWEITAEGYIFIPAAEATDRCEAKEAIIYVLEDDDIVPKRPDNFVMPSN